MNQPTPIPLAAINFEERAYPRTDLDEERVALLQELYAADGPAALPPVELVVLEGDRYAVADGAHRIQAAIFLRWTDLPAVLVPVPGGWDPVEIAYLRALETASAGAKPLSTAERRTAATRLLAQYPDWSDREIARRVGMSHTTVGSIRAMHGADGAAHETAAPLAATRTAEQISATLVRGIRKAWDAQGLTDMVLGRLPGTLAGALEAEFGDEAVTWAGRLERWGHDARTRLEANG